MLVQSNSNINVIDNILFVAGALMNNESDKKKVLVKKLSEAVKVLQNDLKYKTKKIK